MHQDILYITTIGLILTDYFILLCGRSITTLRPLSHFASKYKGPSIMDIRERGSHPTQDTSQEEEADDVGTKGETPKKKIYLPLRT